MNQISIAIADDHCLMRQTLAYMLNKEYQFEVVFEAGNGLELLEKLEKSEPDILLLDLKMPIKNGLNALEEINIKFPCLRILILTAFIDEIYILECLQHNINGFLSKQMELHEIIAAILMAYENKFYATNLLPIIYLRTYINKYHKNVKDFLPSFSKEEIQILEMLKAENTTNEIADFLFLGRRSIESKREHMKTKAKVKTIAGLLLYAQKRGFIE